MTSLTPEIEQQLCGIAQTTTTLDKACTILDLDVATVRRWIEQPRTDKERKFSAAHRKATALGEMKRRSDLEKHAANDAGAALKLAELMAREKETAARRAAEPKNTPLQNPTHEAFAQLMAKGGKTATEAYQELTGKKRAGDSVTGHRLLRIAKERIDQIQQNAAATARKQLTAARRLEICQEVAESDTATHRDRLSAAKLDAELRGEIIGKQELTGKDGAPLPSIVPAIVISYLPGVMMTPRIAKEGTIMIEGKKDNSEGSGNNA